MKVRRGIRRLLRCFVCGALLVMLLCASLPAYAQDAAQELLAAPSAPLSVACITNQYLAADLCGPLASTPGVDSEQGAALSDVLPQIVTDGDYIYWKAMVQTADQRQQAGGADQSGAGVRALRVRCLQTGWQYLPEGGDWRDFADGEQLTLYYRRSIALQNGVTLQLSDWPLVGLEHCDIHRAVIFQLYDATGAQLPGGASRIYSYYTLQTVGSVQALIDSPYYAVEEVRYDRFAVGALAGQPENVVTDRIPSSFDGLAGTVADIHDFALLLDAGADCAVTVVGIRVATVPSDAQLTVSYQDDRGRTLHPSVCFTPPLPETGTTFADLVTVQDGQLLPREGSGAALEGQTLLLPTALGGSQAAVPLALEMPGYTGAYTAQLSADGKTLSLCFTRALVGYTVRYHYGDTVVTVEGEALFDDAIPCDLTPSKTIDGKDYVLQDGAAAGQLMRADAADNVLDIYYQPDNTQNGIHTPEDPERPVDPPTPEAPSTPDIPSAPDTPSAPAGPGTAGGAVSEAPAVTPQAPAVMPPSGEAPSVTPGPNDPAKVPTPDKPLLSVDDPTFEVLEDPDTPLGPATKEPAIITEPCTRHTVLLGAAALLGALWLFVAVKKYRHIRALQKALARYDSGR